MITNKGSTPLRGQDRVEYSAVIDSGDVLAVDRVGKIIRQYGVQFDFDGDLGIALYNLLLDLYLFAKANNVDFDKNVAMVREDCENNPGFR